MTPRTDYEEAAVARLLAQQRGKPRLEALVRGLASVFQDAETAAHTLLTGRLLGTAVGAALEVLGRVVGEERFADDDARFRLRIRARLLLNRGSGTGEELVRLFLLTLPPGLVPTLVEEYPAALEVRVSGGALPLPDSYARLLRAGKAGGVRALLRYQGAPDADMLRTATGSLLAAPSAAGAASLVLVDATSLPLLGQVVLDDGTGLREVVAYSSRTATTLALSAPATLAHAAGAAASLLPGRGLDTTSAAVLPVPPGLLASVR